MYGFVMLKFLVVGFGGFIGAVLRYTLSGLVERYFEGPFPAGTLFVNVLGCFVIGSIMYMVEDWQALAPNSRLFIMVGILGSLTTFSTFGYETVELLKEGCLNLAVLNIATNLGAGIGGVMLGIMVIKVIKT